MRARHVASIITFTILTGTALSALDGPATPSAEAVVLSRDAQGLIRLPVMINGNGPFRFLLDTGSNRSAISAKLAGQFSLPAVATTALVSSTSSTTAPVVRLDALGVGGVAKRGLLVPVLPAAAQAALGAGTDGVLGQDFLLDENYTIDYVRLRLAWHGEAMPESGEPRLTLKKDEGRWLVALPQGDTAPTLWFVPDSGSAAFVLFDRGVAPTPLQVTPIRRVTASTVTAEGEAMAALLRTLRVGTIVFDHQPAVVIARRGADAPLADGLLPLSAFSQVTFDARAGTMSVRR